MQTQSVSVTAPSKTILFGEHSVVYGQPALVSALNRRLVMTVRKSIGRVTDDIQRPCITFPGVLDRNLVLTRADVEEFLQSVNINRDEMTYFKQVKEWMSSKFASYSQSISDTCSAILVIFTHQGIINFDQLEVIIDSEIPIGAGLGSSAALSVVTAACCLILDGSLSDKSDEWTSENREQISDLAFMGEKVFHGSPSGLDNTIVTFGGVLSYTRGVGMTLLPTNLRLRILVINTKIPRTTSLMVEGVRKRREENPEKYDAIFADIGQIVTQLVSMISDNESETIISSVKKNQDLLREMGVSHSVIDEIVELVSGFGISAKLTGAGGGGCVIAFLPSDFGKEETMSEMLREKGFDVWSTTLGADGVHVRN